ncbi:MAG: orotidine 5'-phosphate decarboxylase [Gemmatimonadetes bacterium]|nr:orotidine 5'-phosphate decarboxylase [Gemmatimonadota bacterium]
MAGEAPGLLDGTPKVQVSLDLPTIEVALATAEIAVRAGVDWLEAGTPLILGEGLHAVRALHERFPDHPVIADLKTMDAGYLEAEMMFNAGATFVVVMAVAHEHTVREAVRAARELGGYVMADVMLHPDKPAAARRMQELGADVIVVHTGLDERHAELGKSPLDDLAAVRAAVSIPLQAVGGLSLEQAARTPALGAALAVIGAPLAVADRKFTPGADDDALLQVISEFVKRVKGA